MGWRIFSSIDTTEYLADTSNMQIVDYNRLCEIEPAIGIWDFPIGTDLQPSTTATGSIFDNASGRQIPPENFYVPPSNRV